MNQKTLVSGIATFIPGAMWLYHRRAKTGGGKASLARYCYSVWLRHSMLAYANGLCTRIPRRVAELGPGDSIGLGIAALLSGAESYSGFDVYPYSNLANNIRVFDELLPLFRNRVPVPTEFDDVRPAVQRTDFPQFLEPDLSPHNIERIRYSILHPNEPGSAIRYQAPWNDNVQPGTVDMIFSQAVLEHVDDVAGTYRTMYQWLAPGGLMSHQIDLRSHGTAHQLNGHYTIGDVSWRLMRGRRPYWINRVPRSEHITLLRSAGFDSINVLTEACEALPRAQLARPFRHLTDDDIKACGLFVQARK
jgi:hypothetical protein